MPEAERKMEIAEVLRRRGDLSTFLVHLTKASDSASAMENLTFILDNQGLKAGHSFGPAVARFEKEGKEPSGQKAVCFTETPFEYLHLLCVPIAGRQVQLEPYGVALTKRQGRRLGVNPVWYIDTTPRNPFEPWLTGPLNKLIDAAINDPTGSAGPVLQLTPYMDTMGTWQYGKKEFWWEREWRSAGDVALPESFFVIAPEAQHEALQQKHDHRLHLLDANWSLEQMIARLAGFKACDCEAP